MLKEHIEKLADELDLDLSFHEEKRSFTLPINETLTVEVFEKKPGCFFFSRIAPLFEEKKEEFLLHAMEGNFLGRATGSSVLGLDENKEYLTLSLNIPYEITYRTLHETLEDFVNYVVFWQKEMKTFREKAKNGPLI